MGAPGSRGVAAAVAFFVAAGLVEIAAAFYETQPLSFWPLWEAFFRGSLDFILALGLWRRLALCRSVAMVYCLAALVTYSVVLGMAVFRAPILFPASVKLQSLLHVPSCALLLPFLRSREASRLFPRALFGP